MAADTLIEIVVPTYNAGRCIIAAALAS